MFLFSRRAAVIDDALTSPFVPGGNCMDAAVMSFQQHGWGNHAVRSGTDGVGMTEVRFPTRRALNCVSRERA
jgi:hypothetical protein